MLWHIVVSLAHVWDSVAFSVYGLALLPTCRSGATVLSFAYCAVSLQLSPLLRYLLFLFSCSKVCSLSTYCLPLVYPLSTPCLPIVYPLSTHCLPPCLPIVYPLSAHCLPLVYRLTAPCLPIVYPCLPLVCPSFTPASGALWNACR